MKHKIYKRKRSRIIQRIITNLKVIVFSSFILPSLIISQNINCQMLHINYDYQYDKGINESSICFNDSLAINNSTEQKIIPQVGFQIGTHSLNMDQNTTSIYREGIAFEAYIKFRMLENIHPIIAFVYWQSRTKEINNYFDKISSEAINSKGIRFELDFSLLMVGNLLLSTGPSISIEQVTNLVTSVYTIGTNVKIHFPVWHNKIILLSTIRYQTGGEAFNFGGGKGYTFIFYLLGTEINVNEIFGK